MPVVSKAADDSSDFEMVEVDPQSLDQANAEYGIMPLKTFYGSGAVAAVGKGSQSGQKSLSSMYAKLKKNSKYRAYFYGSAVTKDGKQGYVVVNNAYITFTYK